MIIRFLGDSITAGSRGSAVGYPIYVEKFLKEKYGDILFEFKNCGIWGDQTIDLQSRIESGEIEVEADIMFLFIGVNDVLKSFDDKSLSSEQFASRYENLVKTIRDKSSAPLIILEPYLISDDAMRSHKRSLLIEFNEQVFKTAKKYADCFVPLDGKFKAVSLKDDITTYTVDGLHLSDKGAKFVASACYDDLEEIIEKNRVGYENVKTKVG